MDILVGVDPSASGASVVRLTSSVHETWQHKSSEKERNRVCDDVHKAVVQYVVDNLLGKGEPTVWIEEPVVGVNKRTAIMQAQIQGVLLGSFGSLLNRVYSVSNSAWKKEVVGAGNASKQACAQWLSDHEPELAKTCGGDRDLVDAGLVALYGRAVQRRAGRLTA
jgi:Holliday junction resolvasome RuvABC endonuclease subunit